MADLPALLETTRAHLLVSLQAGASRLGSWGRSAFKSLQGSVNQWRLQSNTAAAALHQLLRDQPALCAGCGAAAGLALLWRCHTLMRPRSLVRRAALPEAYHRVVGELGAHHAAKRRLSSASAGCPPMQVVLTGGPSGGKSSLAAHLAAALQQRGVTVFVAPSVAALFLNCGCPRPDPEDAHGLLQFECAVLQLQLQLEASFQRIAAATGERVVVVYDRCRSVISLPCLRH